MRIKTTELFKLYVPSYLMAQIALVSERQGVSKSSVVLDALKFYQAQNYPLTLPFHRFNQDSDHAN